MQLTPRVLTPEEMKAWGLPEMIPIFPPEEVIAIEAKWSKAALQGMAVEYFLSPVGDKALLVQKLLYVGALDEKGEPTELPVGEPAQVPYVIGDPKKFCCSLCGACAPEELLKEGRFFDRMAWLRRHYKEAHPGVWGRGKTRTPSVKYLPEVAPAVMAKIWNIIDRTRLRKYCEEVYGVPVAAEASDYFARIMVRNIDGFKIYLPLHLIDHRALTAQDMYNAASQYFD